MIITFCGHSKIVDKEAVRERLTSEICNLLSSGYTTFYLGGYGDFDLMAASVLREMKDSYPSIDRVLVLPYLDRKYDEKLYDSTVYPPLESVPKRFAISKRNEWMVEQADVVIAYVTHDWGGAVKTLEYAVRKKSQIINIGGVRSDET
ncbi:MAG: DUF1273 family protein [Clostridia bacterium]|nr:DUF1273 family protein [Clostridia bacterium]